MTDRIVPHPETTGPRPRAAIETRAVVKGATPGIRITCRLCDPPAVTVVSRDKVLDMIRRHMQGVHDTEVRT